MDCISISGPSFIVHSLFAFGGPTMQIQVNTDRHLDGSAELITQVETTMKGALSRFSNRITRLEVYLSDENGSQKSGSSDKRCVLEARLTGMKPIKVSADGSSLELALNDAANNLEKLLGRTLDRLDSHKGRASFAGEATE
jgi:ribosome-associated translation inhibitor RaiA